MQQINTSLPDCPPGLTDFVVFPNVALARCFGIVATGLFVRGCQQGWIVYDRMPVPVAVFDNLILYRFQHLAQRVERDGTG